MALRWFLHSACHVLGYPKEPNNLQYCNNMASKQNGGHGSGVIQSSKVSNCDQTSQTTTEMHFSSGFQMPIHYPRYTKADYEKMEEWKVDMLLREYGLSFMGSLDEKRAYAMGAFLWPHQY
ncbi:uncharacterized protein LOC111274292 [Durio zibethinus]|uniref:Uncharacterized protein LOC111274065 n=1 Tax=Durio zibethinus TaxID=66656 RepID=A0A6P5WF21_DURZI|nr:uncharacterized protein LOC111274065 [Durio zibethinus]XP_022714619.1 uncharacterized protein LOC111274292 [Durio zibethinus]